MSTAASHSFFGLNFAAVSLDEAAAMVVARPADAAFAYVVTPNVDQIVTIMGERGDLMPVYQGAWLRLCDSRVLRLLGRLRGAALTVVTGSDLVARLFQRCIRPDDPLTIVGCADATVEKLCAAYGLTRVAHYNPPMGFMEHPVEVEVCVRFVVAHPARYVFLAVGSPQKEILAAKIAAAGKAVGLGLCIGASLNFLVGAEKRAPRWMQQCCLEWLHRLLADPRRMWRRYLVRSPRIFALLLRENGAARSTP